MRQQSQDNRETCPSSLGTKSFGILISPLAIKVLIYCDESKLFLIDGRRNKPGCDRFISYEYLKKDSNS